MSTSTFFPSASTHTRHCSNCIPFSLITQHLARKAPSSSKDPNLLCFVSSDSCIARAAHIHSFIFLRKLTKRKCATKILPDKLFDRTLSVSDPVATTTDALNLFVHASDFTIPSTHVYFAFPNMHILCSNTFELQHQKNFGRGFHLICPHPALSACAHHSRQACASGDMSHPQPPPVDAFGYCGSSAGTRECVMATTMFP